MYDNRAVCKKFWRAFAINFETSAASCRLPFGFNVELVANMPTSSSHPTMDPSCDQGISNHVNSKFKWKQNKLVLSLDTDGNKQVRFDVVPYLGIEARQVLTFPNNSSIDQKQIIALFKEQA